jgi:hypothetical protein
VRRDGGGEFSELGEPVIEVVGRPLKWSEIIIIFGPTFLSMPANHLCRKSAMAGRD